MNSHIAMALALAIRVGRSHNLKTIDTPPPEAGRNDPCPCKSGKKYKRCCIGKNVVRFVDKSSLEVK